MPNVCCACSQTLHHFVEVSYQGFAVKASGSSSVLEWSYHETPALNNSDRPGKGTLTQTELEYSLPFFFVHLKERKHTCSDFTVWYRYLSDG